MLNIMIAPQTQPQAPQDVVVKPKPVHNSLLQQDILTAPILVEGSEGTDQLALFHRHEITVGALVGSGSFSEVFEISSFVLPQQKTTLASKMKAFRTKSGNKDDLSLATTASIASMEPSRRRKRKSLMEQHEQNRQDLFTGKTLKSRYVIKQLHPKLLADPKLFRRALKDLATEVSIMSLCDHPHIAQLHATAFGGAAVVSEAGASHNSYFLVLDRLVSTLDERTEAWNREKVRVGPAYYLDSATNDAKMALKANYALQIASALRYLHERRIVFRDLKPQNIGFKEVHPDHPERDVLALFDFGLSRNLPSPEKANADGLYKLSMVGTRRYMAPEVVTTRTYDDRADTYSWSLVFYELITQIRPFDGIKRAEHKQFVCVDGKRPKIYAYYGFPPELERLLRLAWAQDATVRITMGEVCDTLTQYLAGTIHEGCVRQPQRNANNKPAVIHDDSISSLLSYSTEQTMSTTNSFTLEEETTKQPTSETGAAAGVPQAIAVTSPDVAAPPQQPQHEQEEAGERRVSVCERAMNVFCKSLTKALHMFR